LFLAKGTPAGEEENQRDENKTLHYAKVREIAGSKFLVPSSGIQVSGITKEPCATSKQ
jgi:hypothetical protein